LRVHLVAEGRQIDFARTSVLFSALAAEAFVNAALAEKMSGEEFAGVDKLRTVDKYVFGPQVAIGRRLFERGQEPAQSIAQLFKLRDRLVHAKPRSLTIDKRTFGDPRYEEFNPPAAARYLTAVAGAVATLYDACEMEPGAVVMSIDEHKDRFIEFGESLREELPAPPGDQREQGFGLAAVLKPHERAERKRVRHQVPPPVATTVPRGALDLLRSIQQLPGTATGPIRSDQTDT
jgi:hypothetical protein